MGGVGRGIVDSFVEDMETLNQSFRDFVERERLFTKTDKLLLACSGGLDSTVLAHLLHEEGYNFSIAHMNFQLRGEASAGDAAFAEELARTLGATFYCKAVDVKAEAKPGESTQMVARRLRYEWFLEVFLQEEFACLLTAHHLDDNFETLLLNLIRGTGIKGISGIAPKSTYKNFTVRPLLNSSRSTLHQYALAKNLSWREDTSNATDDYLRNRIRHKLTPLFREEFGLTDHSLARTLANLRHGEKMFDHGIQKFLHDSITVTDVAVVDRTQWPHSEELYHFMHDTIHSIHLPQYAFGKFTDEQFRQIAYSKTNRIIRGQTGHAKVQSDVIIFDGLFPEQAPLRFPEPIIDEPVDFPAFRVIGHLNAMIELLPRPTNLSQPNTLYLAPPTFPLHLRPRKKGDRFQPLGLGGKTKKVKDYMIDQKIPVWLRDRIYLLVNENDEIMAIPGYCVSENFKVLPEHEEVLRISWK